MRVRRILQLVVVGFAALVIPITAAMAQAEFLPNTDRPGNDLGPPIALEFKQNSFLTFEMECAGLCAKDPGCKAWTMVKPGVQGPKAQCYLKGTPTASVNNNCCSSSPRYDVDADQKLNRSMNPEDFEGLWDTVTRDTKFTLSLFVSGTHVTGTYTSPGQPDWDGTIEGEIKIIGDTMRLRYQWNSPKLGQSGEGTFYVHTDDRLTGGITVKEAGKAKDTYYRWKGKRISRFPVIDYGGCAGCTSGGGTTGGGATGGGGGGVPAEWADTLNAHNAKRAMHRTPALSWSANLAAGAQAWANNCDFAHSESNDSARTWLRAATSRARIRSSCGMPRSGSTCGIIRSPPSMPA